MKEIMTKLCSMIWWNYTSLVNHIVSALQIRNEMQNFCFKVSVFILHQLWIVSSQNFRQGLLLFITLTTAHRNNGHKLAFNSVEFNCSMQKVIGITMKITQISPISIILVDCDVVKIDIIKFVYYGRFQKPFRFSVQ